jgi:hypothetical protein
MATPAKIPPKGPPKSDPRAPSTQQLEERAAKKKAMAGIAARGKKKYGRGPSKAAIAATYARWHAPKAAKAKAAADHARANLDPMPMPKYLPGSKTIIPPPNPERDAAVGDIRTTPSPTPTTIGGDQGKVGFVSAKPLGRKSVPSNARGLSKPPKPLKRAPGQTNTRSHI